MSDRREGHPLCRLLTLHRNTPHKLDILRRQDWVMTGLAFGMTMAYLIDNLICTFFKMFVFVLGPGYIQEDNICIGSKWKHFQQIYHFIRDVIILLLLAYYLLNTIIKTNIAAFPCDYLTISGSVYSSILTIV